MALKRFAYASAESVDDALATLSWECRPLAGGTDLLPMMKEELATPTRLMDIKRLPGLGEMTLGGNEIRIGAMAPLYRVEPFAREQGLACLAEAIAESASPQIRHMATLGGNLLQRPRCWYFRNKLTYCLRKGGKRCFAVHGENKYHAILGGGPCYIVHPSDPAVALLALDANVVIQGAGGSRTVPLGEFYLLPKQDAHREAAIGEDELVTAVNIPMPVEGASGAYLKVAERRAWDFALVSAAAQLVIADGKVQRARLALGGVAPIPWRAKEAEAALEGQPLTPEVIARAASFATAGARPLEHNAYKVELAQGAMKGVLTRLM